jgi:hypothetical protein
MAERITKVLYDVRDAIKNLNKLNKKVEESGDKAEEAFEKGVDGSRLFQTALNRVPGSARKAAASISAMGASSAALTGLAAGAAVAVGSLVAQFIDLPALLRDSAAGMDAFRNATQGVLDAENAISSVNDALINAENKRRSRGLRQKQAELDFLQVETKAKQDLIRDELTAAKAALNERTRAVKSSVKTRLDLEAKLAARRGTQFAAGSGAHDPDIRASILQDRALEQAQKGNIEAAEKLVEQAEALQPELQNQAFFLAQNEDVNAAINAEIEKQIAATKQSEAAAKSQLTVDQARVAALEAQNKELDRQNRAITGAKTTVGAEIKQAREQKVADINTQSRDEAARELSKVAKDINRELVDGGRSVRQSVIDSFRQSLDNLKQGGIADEAANQIRTGLSALTDAFAVLDKQRAGTATFGDFADLGQSIEKVAVAVGALEVAQARGDIGGGFTTDIDQLNRIVETLKLTNRAAERAFAADALPSTLAQEGTESPFDRFGREIGDAGGLASSGLDVLTNSAASAAEKLAAIGAINVGGQVGIPGPETPTPSQTPVPSQKTEITVNSRVEGGMIDTKAIEQITDIIKREVRKATSTG